MSDTLRFKGAVRGPGRKRDGLTQTAVTRAWQRPSPDVLTVFSGETSNNRRFWAQPEIVHGLDFEVICSEGVGIIDVVL